MEQVKLSNNERVIKSFDYSDIVLARHTRRGVMPTTVSGQRKLVVTNKRVILTSDSHGKFTKRTINIENVSKVTTSYSELAKTKKVKAPFILMIIFGALLAIGGLFLNVKIVTLMTVLIGLGLLAGGIIGLCKKPKYNNNYALYIAIYTKGEEHISMKDYVYSSVGDTNDTKNLEAENITEIIMCNPESAKKLANELSDAILEAQESK